MPGVEYSREPTSGEGKTRRLTVRLVVALLALGAVAALRTLAYSSPPDPDWIPGLYDNADFDDVVLLATSTPASLEVAPPPLPDGVLRIVAMVVPSPSPRPSRTTPEGEPTRGPPSAPRAC